MFNCFASFQFYIELKFMTFVEKFVRMLNSLQLTIYKLRD